MNFIDIMYADNLKKGCKAYNKAKHATMINAMGVLSQKKVKHKY